MRHGRRTDKQSHTRKDMSCTSARLTVRRPENLFPHSDRYGGPVGRPVAAFCGTPWVMRVLGLQLRRSQPVEVPPTLCSRIGKVLAAAAIGLQTGNTTFFSQTRAQGLTSGPVER